MKYAYVTTDNGIIEINESFARLLYNDPKITIENDGEMIYFIQIA